MNAPMRPRTAQIVYSTAVFLRWFATALPMALLVLLLQSRGLSLLQLGLFIAIHSGVVVLLEVPTGGLADAIGRKRVAILAQVVTLIGMLVGLVSFGFGPFAITAILIGAGRALASGALDAWFVDTLLANDPATDLQAPLATAQALSIAGLALGALAGGALPAWLEGYLASDATAILTPLSVPLLLSAAVHLVLIVLLIVAVVEVRPGQDEASTADGPADGSASAGAPTGLRAIGPILSDAIRAARNDRIVGMILLVTLLGGVAISSLETFWQPRFASLFGGDPATTPTTAFGGILAAAFALGVVGNLVSIPLARFLGRRYARVALIAQAVTAAAILTLAAASTLPLSLVGFWAAYFGSALSASPLATILNEEVPSSRRSSTLSVVSLAGQLGAMVGGAAFGLLADRVGIPFVWTVAGIATVLGVAPLLVIDRMREARRGPDPSTP